MSTKHTLGPDVDLDDEIVLDARGERTTEARARQVADAALQAAREVARRSTTGQGPVPGS